MQSVSQGYKPYIIILIFGNCPYLIVGWRIRVIGVVTIMSKLRSVKAIHPTKISTNPYLTITGSIKTYHHIARYGIGIISFMLKTCLLACFSVVTDKTATISTKPQNAIFLFTDTRDIAVEAL